MKVRGLNTDPVCFGAGYDGENEICTKLCGLSSKCSLMTKEFLLRERDEILRQKEGISQLQFDYESLNMSSRHKRHKYTRERHSLYSADMPEDFYQMDTAQMEALAESRGIVISESHAKLKFEKPYLYLELLKRRVRSTYKLGKRNSRSDKEYQKFLRKRKGETS